MIDTQSIRAKIIDLAMQGQLSVQLAADGTVEDLIQIIKAEKQELIRDGKIKKEKPLPAIDAVPFQIPNGWDWVRWGDLSFQIQYGYNAPAQQKGRIKMVRITDIQNNKVVWQTVPYCDIDEQSIDEYRLKPNNILFARTGGTVGKSFLVEQVEEDAVFAGYLIRTSFSSSLSAKYLKYFMESRLYWKQLQDGTTATAQPNCNAKTLSKMLVPLPPLPEQQRIVERIDQAFSVLDTIDALQGQYADNLTALKSKLIDAAIQGKLTKHLPEDNTAEELYQQVQAERKRQEEAGTIKSVELAPDVIEAHQPFAIPASWKWTHLGNVSYIVRGGSPRPIKQYITNREDGINWIKIGDVEKGGKYIYSTHEKIIPEGESKSRRVYPGDFLLTNSMSFGRPYISKIEGCIHDGWLLIHDLKGFDPDYLYYLLSSSYLYGQFTVKASGSTVDNLNIDKVSSAIIPLPPLAEQKRIAQKIDELLPIISAGGQK